MKGHAGILHMTGEDAVMAAWKLGVAFDPASTSIPDEALGRLHPDLIATLLVIVVLADQWQPLVHSNALLFRKTVPDRSPGVEGLSGRFEQVFLVSEHEETTTGSADRDCCAVPTLHEPDTLGLAWRRGASDKGE